jgi:hypothetical protein
MLENTLDASGLNARACGVFGALCGAVFSGITSSNMFDAIDPFDNPSRALFKFQVGDAVVMVVDFYTLRNSEEQIACSIRDAGLGSRQARSMWVRMAMLLRLMA